MKWNLVVTPEVQAGLRTLAPKIQCYVRQALREIEKDPWIGKPLRDELAGLYSFRAGRFRVVYRIRREAVTVAVIGVGPRDRIYEIIGAEILSGRSHVAPGR